MGSDLSSIKVILDEEMGAVTPTKGYMADAGFDLYAPNCLRDDIYIEPKGYAVIDTGVHMLIPEGYAGIIISKSGLNINHSIKSTGLIDSGYTGSIKIKLYNYGQTPYKINPGSKISQIVILPIAMPIIEIAKYLPDTDRGNNGFGSTGI